MNKNEKQLHKVEDKITNFRKIIESNVFFKRFLWIHMNELREDML